MHESERNIQYAFTHSPLHHHSTTHPFKTSAYMGEFNALHSSFSVHIQEYMRLYIDLKDGETQMPKLGSTPRQRLNRHC